MPSWPAQGLRFSGLQHPPGENANFALASKSSKSIEDSSKKFDFLPFCKIVVSVDDDTPSAKMTFLQLPTSRCCKIRTLAREIQSSVRRCITCRFKSRSWHVRAWNLSSWSFELVKIEPEIRQVGAWNVSRSSLALAKLMPGTCQARACNLSGSSLVEFKPTTYNFQTWRSNW